MAMIFLSVNNFGLALGHSLFNFLKQNQLRTTIDQLTDKPNKRASLHEQYVLNLHICASFGLLTKIMYMKTIIKKRERNHRGEGEIQSGLPPFV